MFTVNDDMSIHVTRGDHISIDLSAATDSGKYSFRIGDLVRFKVVERKACDRVVLKKDVRVTEETETVSIVLTGEDTKFGEVISKPVDYWYEVELNPDIQPQTIIGYDVNGAKVFRLYPEGGEVV